VPEQQSDAISVFHFALHSSFFNCPLHFAKLRHFQGILEKQKNNLSTHGGTIPIAELGNIEHRIEGFSER
jgi:hypothetical protein